MRRLNGWMVGLGAAVLANACAAEEQAVVEPPVAAETSGVEEQAAGLPQKLDREGFGTMIADAGPVYIAGQPSEAALAEMQAEGVTTVINLRTEAEMLNRNAVPFDEAAAVDGLGMEYVLIEQGDESTLTPAALDAFAAAMSEADGKVLVHCGSGVRASHMWAAYLVKTQGVSMEDALAQAEAMNLRSVAPVRALLGLEAEAPG